jgi:hypothetical protein
MKRIYYLILVSLSLFILHCQKELSFNKSMTGASPVTATIQGNVVDENEAPAQGVTITVDAKTAVTDAKGYFRIRNASLDNNASLVIAEKNGYFKAFRVFSASKAVNQVRIKLLKKDISGTVSSSSGGAVALANGSIINFSANSFSNLTGAAYSGTVNVYAHYIDPTRQDIGETVPGSFLGNDKDNRRVILTSYGMLAVELESSTGEKLQISSGNTAKLSFPIPSAQQTSAPNQIALWYIDEKTGLWKEEGSAIKNGNTYEADVKHFTYWNCDVSGPTVNLAATFVQSHGVPLVYTGVTIRPQTGWATAHGYTDSLGQVNGPVPANIPLVLEVVAPYPCYNVIYSQNIGPFSSNVNLGTITVNANQSVITIQGTLTNCSGGPVTQGHAIIEYDNIIRYASVNASGNFTSTFVSCGSGPANGSITGVDIQAQQQGQSTPVTITLPVTNAGTLTACGTSTLEYVNYTLDGSPVNLSSTTSGDSFAGHDVDSVGTGRTVYIQGYRSQATNLTLHFPGSGVAGSFQADFISVNNYQNITLLQPFTITLTSYPAVGGFFEGSFTGQFKDASNMTHSLNGTLRVKRR